LTVACYGAVCNGGGTTVWIEDGDPGATVACYCTVGDGEARIPPAADPTSTVACYCRVCDAGKGIFALNRVAACGRIISNCTVGDGGRGIHATNCATIVGRIATYCAVCDVRGRITTQDSSAHICSYNTVCNGGGGIPEAAEDADPATSVV